MYILHYDNAALLLNIINIVLFLYLKNLRDMKSRILFVMLANSLLTTFLDILSAIAISNPDTHSYSYTLFITTIYYLTNNNKVYIYVAYILILSGLLRQISGKKRYMLTLPFAVTTILILMNPFTHTLFYIDSTLQYQRGIGLLIIYTIDFMFLTYGTISAIRHKRTMNRVTFRALSFFVFVYIFTLTFQTLYPSYLLQSIGTALCELILIMILQNRNEVIDGTTKLFNQNAFFDKLLTYIDNGVPFSITLIMLEDATRISYTLGYHYLNMIIQEVSLFVKEQLSADEKYYVRGNCYALLFTTDSEQRRSVNKRILMDRFKESWHINDFNINLSVRSCQLNFPEDITSSSDVFDYIDHLTIAPSSDIKDNLIGISEVSLNHHKREREIRKAVALAMLHQTFEVYYQPIYSVRDQSFNSAEALVRLRDPQLGFLPPDEFIPLTERDGTITKLGMHIFEMVCSFLKASDLTKKGVQYIEVNLSVVQCMQIDLKEQLTSLMSRYQISPEQICLEITETVAVNTPDAVRVLFKELDLLGMSFALDDYGSGYSNVNYILELPFDLVKLDKSIIWGYFADKKGKITLESTIAMMKSLSIDLVAEGVETKEQAETLTTLGVNYHQGYYYSKPVKAEEFIAFISERNV